MTITSDNPTTIPAGFVLGSNQAPPLISSPSVLNTFISTSAPVACDWIDSFDGVTVDASSQFSVQKVGRLVSMYLYPFAGAVMLDSTSFLRCSVALPAGMSPASTANVKVVIRNGSTDVAGGAAVITTGGVVSLQGNTATTGGFGAGAIIAISGITLMWHTS
jgi:hypothetical protein